MCLYFGFVSLLSVCESVGTCIYQFGLQGSKCRKINKYISGFYSDLSKFSMQNIYSLIIQLHLVNLCFYYEFIRREY